MAKVRITWLLVFLFLGFSLTSADISVEHHELTVLRGTNGTFLLDGKFNKPLSADVEVMFDVEHAELIKIYPRSFNISKGQKSNLQWEITVSGLNLGRAVLSANVTPPVTRFSDAFVRVTIERSTLLYHVSSVVGWIYFLAWSVSFYPQIYTNYKRKSVVGLSFDFLSLNLVGFFMYALFNCGLLWIPTIEEEYFHRHPRGLNPVQMNDVFFAVHAIFATVVTIIQCFIYERGNQRVSTTARVIHALFAIFIVITAIMAWTNTLSWLDFLYNCSYVKLAITLIKYVPQAFYNYKRQSTVGWSIGNIFLDFVGGVLSMQQMILNAINYDDWESIFGDPTKFGLGLFSVAFDILFIIQHYILYRDRGNYAVLEGDCHEGREEEASTSVSSTHAKL